MLNIAERFQVLKTFRICCILGLLPVQVDLQSWKLKAPSKIKRCICGLSFGALAVQTLYKIGSLAYTYAFDPNVQHHQLVIHVVLAMASAVATFWYKVLYLDDPGLFAKYLNVTLVGKFGGSLDLEDPVNEQCTRRLREYSVQDVAALWLTHVIALVVPVMMASYVYDPTMSFLLYNALPSRLQNWSTFGLCAVEEFRFILNILVIGVPVCQLQVISYDLVSDRLRRLMRKIDNGAITTRTVYSSLRRLQLYVCMVNNVNSYVLFTLKLLAITMGILTGYSALAHFHQHPIFGIMYYLLLFDMATVYTVIYDKAFKIPQLFNQATTSALLNMRGNRRGIFSRQIKSIPQTGIKVGHFHTMERASTLIFIDFVLRNIVSMLVAYR